MSIHERIRTGRKKLGLTEQQFADAVGVSRGAVQQWEKEGGTAPKRKNQAAVARKLGITVAELMDGAETDADLETVSFSVAEPDPPPYDPLVAEAVKLLEEMGRETRIEAVKYLRYLAGSPRPRSSPDDPQGNRDTFPPPAKAA